MVAAQAAAAGGGEEGAGRLSAAPISGAGTAVVEIELRSKTRLRLEGEAALRAVAGLIGRIR